MTELTREEELRKLKLEELEEKRLKALEYLESIGLAPDELTVSVFEKEAKRKKKKKGTTTRPAKYAHIDEKGKTHYWTGIGRGVDVRVVVDKNGNRSKVSKAALNLLVNAGIPIRTIAAYKIHHDKVIIADGKTTETGSFNYSRAADRSNSENVIVIRDNPDVAKIYLAHWQSRWEQGQNWTSTY